MLDQFWTQLSNISWVEWLGTIAGFAGVWLGIQEKVASWAAYIICYSCYVYISFDYGLRAFTTLNAVFILISIYGWIQWKRGKTEDIEASHPTYTSTSLRVTLLLLLTLSICGIGYLLEHTGEAKFPYWDAAACSLALVAQWLLTRKHVETWLVWIFSDIIYLTLFIQNQAWPTVILFTGFICLAVKGLRDWSRQVQRQPRSQPLD